MTVTLEHNPYDASARRALPWTRLSWTLRLAEPWSTISATLALPFAQRHLAPAPDDVLVVQTPSRMGRAWGYVSVAPEPGLETEPDAKRFSSPITVNTHSCLLQLRNAQLLASAPDVAFTPETVGTMFSLEDWQSVMSVIADTPNSSLGPTMVKLVSLLAQLEMPGTLGGRTLGETLTVIHNDDTARAFGRGRPCPPVYGTNIMAVQSLFADSTNALDYILGVCLPDRRLVEFFETLEPPALESNLGREGLNGTPAIWFRTAPFQTQDLASYMAGNQSRPLPLGAIPSAQTLAMFATPTWPRAKGVTIPRGSINQFPMPQRSGADRINAVTASLPTQAQNPFRSWAQAGLPWKIDESVRRFGMKLWEVNYPFLDPQALDLLAGMRVIAALGAMMFIGQERFRRGTFVVKPMNHAIEIGTWVTLDLGNDRAFRCYVEAVTHTITKTPDGKEVSESSVQYSRGLFDEDERREVKAKASYAAITPVEVPQPPAAPAPAQTVCREGRGTTFPSDLSFDESKVPPSLYTWAVDAGWSMTDLKASDETKRKRVLVSAAVGRVVEYYWRMSLSDARVKAISTTRFGESSNNHTSGASFDHVVIAGGQPLGVLQTWTALNLLGSNDNRRIPRGGRGLYLNTSPSGIKGWLPAQAGQASTVRPGKVGPFPLGGSAGVHYDYRSAFGFVNEDSPDPTTWVACDIDGDGRDELTLTRGNQEVLVYLRTVLPQVRNYFDQGGAFDITMKAPDNTVPNVMQMLGQEPFCGLR